MRLVELGTVCSKNYFNYYCLLTQLRTIFALIFGQDFLARFWVMIFRQRHGWVLSFHQPLPFFAPAGLSPPPKGAALAKQGQATQICA